MPQFGVFLYLHIGILFIGVCSTEICTKCQIPAKDQIKIYERFVKKSQAWNKRDNNLLKTWNQEFQLKQINLTAEYRIKIKTQKELSFKTIESNNDKWNQCMNLYKNEITKDEEGYYEKETECLTSANTVNNQELETGSQLEKEIKKWRKSFKYLKSLCKSSADIDEMFALCLVDYVRRDQFDVVFKRLRSMKTDFMRNIISKQNTTLADLEYCFEQNISSYMDKVHRLITNINICYEKRNRNTRTDDSKLEDN